MLGDESVADGRRIRVAEAFAGVGGFRVGFDAANDALGCRVYDTVWANQWEPDGRASRQFAWECYERHYDSGSCVNEDVSVVLDGVAANERELPEYDLLCGGFPCFPAGRLVLTDRGLVPIEDVRVGDLAYTHRSRWRRVTDVMRHVADATVMVSGDGGTIECTPNHRFWSRADGDSDPGWVRASDLAGRMWLTTSAASACDAVSASMPECVSALADGDALWYEVGRWCGTGRVSYRDGGLVVEQVERHGSTVPASLAFASVFTAHASGATDDGGVRLESLPGARNDAVAAWLSGSFGSRAQGRHLPAWLFGARRGAREAVLRGFLDACATHDGESRVAQGVPYALAVGMRVLASGVGMPSAIGAVSHGRCSLAVRDAGRGGETVASEDGVWSRVGSVSEGRRGVTVYNITVDEDHSYTVDGVVVKNCQAFSVARTLGRSVGLDDVPGGKGVLWWQLDRMIRMSHPKWCLFENVDRLLKSPASNRGRDFATILACLADTGYDVEWRVVNAADYGNPQRRRRVFILCTRHDVAVPMYDGMGAYGAYGILKRGVLARALPMVMGDGDLTLSIPRDPSVAFSDDWRLGKRSPFGRAGAMTSDGVCVTCDYEPDYDGPSMTLGDVLVSVDQVPVPYFVSDADVPGWQRTRESKRISRVDAHGHEYVYSEGAMPFPDRLDAPARTILTAGGHGPSRMKHVIATGLDQPDHRYRLLTPVELERLQRFPDGWTVGMSDAHRIFCMGNALVTDIPRRIGIALANSLPKE